MLLLELPALLPPAGLFLLTRWPKRSLLERAQRYGRRQSQSWIIIVIEPTGINH